MGMGFRTAWLSSLGLWAVTVVAGAQAQAGVENRAEAAPAAAPAEPAAPEPAATAEPVAPAPAGQEAEAVVPPAVAPAPPVQRSEPTSVQVRSVPYPPVTRRRFHHVGHRRVRAPLGLSVGLSAGLNVHQHNGWERMLGEHRVRPYGVELGYDLCPGAPLRLTLMAGVRYAEVDGESSDLSLHQTQGLLGGRLGYVLRLSYRGELTPFVDLAAGLGYVALDLEGNGDRLHASGLSALGTAGVGFETRLHLNRSAALRFIGLRLYGGVQGGTRVSLKPKDSESLSRGQTQPIPVRYGTLGELGMFAPFIRAGLFVGF